MQAYGANASVKERYEKCEKVGEGTYGIVYKGRDTEQRNAAVAIKKIRHSSHDEGVPQSALREIGLLRAVNHPNIVKLLDVELNESKLALIFEWCDKDLKKYLDTHVGKLSSGTLKRLTYEMMAGITACHTHGLIHRDLKPQNVLIAPDGVLKLADFGLGKAFSCPMGTMTHEVVTLWYRAPEILLAGGQHNKYSIPVDMWAVGAIFAEMANKKALFPADSEIAELYKIFGVCGTPTEQIWPGCTKYPDWKRSFPQFKAKSWETVCPGLDRDGLDLLAKLLTYDPSRRISGKEAMNHPYFAGL